MPRKSANSASSFELRTPGSSGAAGARLTSVAIPFSVSVAKPVAESRAGSVSALLAPVHAGVWQGRAGTLGKLRRVLLGLEDFGSDHGIADVEGFPVRPGTAAGVLGRVVCVVAARFVGGHGFTAGCAALHAGSSRAFASHNVVGAQIAFRGRPSAFHPNAFARRRDGLAEVDGAAVVENVLRLFGRWLAVRSHSDEHFPSPDLLAIGARLGFGDAGFIECADDSARDCAHTCS